MHNNRAATGTCIGPRSTSIFSPITETKGYGTRSAVRYLSTSKTVLIDLKLVM